MHDDQPLLPVGQLRHARLQLGQRDAGRALDGRDLDLVGLAHVQQQEGLAARQPGRDLRNRSLGHRRLHGLLAGPRGAELVVVDQLGQAGVLAADGALGVLAQPELGEAHVQGRVLEEAADERFAHAGDQLHGLGGLDDGDQPGQDAQHTALGARRHQAGGGGSGYRQR